MTYEEFMTGLYAKYHYVPDSSISFIPVSKNSGDAGVTFEEIIALIVDAERVLKQVKNKNMVKTFELIAQGYFQWEIAEMLEVSISSIEKYVRTIKNFLN